MEDSAGTYQPQQEAGAEGRRSEGEDEAEGGGGPEEEEEEDEQEELRKCAQEAKQAFVLTESQEQDQDSEVIVIDSDDEAPVMSPADRKRQALSQLIAQLGPGSEKRAAEALEATRGGRGHTWTYVSCILFFSPSFCMGLRVIEMWLGRSWVEAAQLWLAKQQDLTDETDQMREASEWGIPAPPSTNLGLA